LYLRDAGPSEVGAFGLSDADDLLFVEDLRLIRQRATAVSVAFADLAVAEFFDEQVDRDLRPEQFARIWIHTHPGHCPTPSSTDEATFQRVFGQTDWAVMFILSATGEGYARLSYHVGPQTAVEIPVAVDLSRPFAASDCQAWQKEYEEAVEIIDPFRADTNLGLAADDRAPRFDPLDDWLTEGEGLCAPLILAEGREEGPDGT
jgi:proteasome lid subunit RPN8/RPN11